MSAPNGNPIIIVGAGVAGLVAAIELQAAGRAVLVLDAAPDVGGRVRTTVQDGLVIDHGFQVLFTAYPTLRRYLDFDRLALRKFLPAARIARDGQVSLIGDALADPGLLAWLMGIANPDDLLRSPLRGALWETAVLAELRRELALRPVSAQLAFWRDRSREVDVLLQRGGRFWLADCKWSATPGSAETRRLRQVAAELPEGQVETMAVICRTPHRHPLGEGIEALPPWELAEAWGLAEG